MNNGIHKPSINWCSLISLDHPQYDTSWDLWSTQSTLNRGLLKFAGIHMDSSDHLWIKGPIGGPFRCPWGSDIPHDSLCAVLAATNRCRNGASKPPSSLRCMSHTWSIHIYILYIYTSIYIEYTYNHVSYIYIYIQFLYTTFMLDFIHEFIWYFFMIDEIPWNSQWIPWWSWAPRWTHSASASCDDMRWHAMTIGGHMRLLQ